MSIDQLTTEFPAEAPPTGAFSREVLAPRRRFVFLIGTARSGTTWLGNILNSSPRSLYSHEPMGRCPPRRFTYLVEQIKATGRLSADEREAVLDHWSRAYVAVRRPPFFAKDYSAWPAKLVWGAWLAMRGHDGGHGMFERLFSPGDDARYDLVAKQVTLPVHARSFVSALSPEGLIVIMRHPCAVIASMLRGRTLGFMSDLDRSAWLDDHLPLCEEVGYGASQVEALSDVEFEALGWLIENTIYLQLADKHPNGQVVLYRDLCQDPMSVTATLFDALGWEVTGQTRRFLSDTTTRSSTPLVSFLTASHAYFSVYRPTKDSINSWRDELSRRQQDEIAEIARPLLDRYWPRSETVRRTPRGDGSTRPADETVRVPLNVQPLSAAMQPVTFGVPLPQGRCREVTAAKLVANTAGPGIEDGVDCQSQVLARWSDGSIKWLLVDAVLSGGGGREATWELRIKGSGFRVQGSEVAPKVRDSIAQGETLGIEADSNGKPQRGATPAAQRDALGRPSSTTDGPHTGLPPEGEGIVPFSVRLVDAKGRRRAARVTRDEVEATGNVRTTRLLEGTIEGCRGIRFRCRLSTFHGSGLIQVRFTLHNSRRARHHGGIWDLGDKGSFLFRELSLEIKGSGFRVQDSGKGSPHAEGEEIVGQLADLHCQSPTFIEWIAEPEQSAQRQDHGTVEIYQDSSGGENWQCRNHVNRDGRVPCRFRGYRLTSPLGTTNGLRACPIVATSCGETSIAAAVPDFWQQFPKSIVATDGRISIGLFPGEWDDLHELQGGEQKTHEVWLNVFVSKEETGTVGAKHPSGRSSLVSSLAWVHQPARVAATPAWIESTAAMPCFVSALVPDDERFSDLLSETVAGANSLFARREAIDEYGWRNYGDVYADHENAYYQGPKPVVSHYNNQYDMVYGLLLHWLRSGDRCWIDLAAPLARHVCDIDIYHTSEDRAVYSGGLFWHTDHYRDAVTASHRCYSRSNAVGAASYGGGPSPAHNYTTGLLHYHYLSGDDEARRAVLQLADWVVAMEDGRKNVLGLLDGGPTGRATESCGSEYCGPGRGAGNSVNALLDAWLLSSNRTYLRLTESLIRRVVHPSDHIDSLCLLDSESRWSYTIFLVALARYLEVKYESDEIDEMYAYGQQSLVHYAKWMLDHESPYFDRPEQLEYPTETWAAQEMRKANVLQLAACHTIGDLRRALQARGEELLERAWTDLWAFESRGSARATAIAMIEGLRAIALRDRRDCMPTDGGDHSFPARPVFISQRERVRRDLCTMPGLTKAGIRLMNPLVWRDVRWSR